jgi:hypothetical protein
MFANSKREIGKALIAMALAALLAGVVARPAQAITFGEEDSDNQFSNVGAIVFTGGVPGIPAPSIVGSGVLIHPRVLLTAGHVTFDLKRGIEHGAQFRVSFAVNAFDPDHWMEFVGLVTHPGYVDENGDVDDYIHRQDVGVVILKEPVDLPCATLASEGLLDVLMDAGLLVNQGTPEEFLAVGYGRTLDFPPPEPVLSGGLRRFEFSEYRALLDAWLFMNKNHRATDDGGAGPGDSGGPRFWIDDNGGLVVVAITTRGDPNLMGHDVAYRMDTAEALDFINLVIAAVEAEGTDSPL